MAQTTKPALEWKKRSLGLLNGAEECGINGRHFGRQKRMHAEQQTLQHLAFQLLLATMRNARERERKIITLVATDERAVSNGHKNSPSSQWCASPGAESAASALTCHRRWSRAAARTCSATQPMRRRPPSARSPPASRASGRRFCRDATPQTFCAATEGGCGQRVSGIE